MPMLTKPHLIALLAALTTTLACCGTTDEQDPADPPAAVANNQQNQATTSASIETSKPRLSDEHSEGDTPESFPTIATANEFNELVGMWTPYWDLEEPNIGFRYEGILLIEFPCVYLYPQRHIEGLYPQHNEEAFDRGSSTTLQSERGLLGLIRNWTYYDPDTESLWVDGEGPMLSEDRVDVYGIRKDSQSHEDICVRDFDIRVEYMNPCRRHDCRIEREARLQETR